MVEVPPTQSNMRLFEVPEPSVARHPSVLLAPRQLQRWVAGLPLANPPKAAQTLLEQLRLLVRDPHPGARLAQLLQAFAAPLDQLQEIVDERLQNTLDGAHPLDQLECTVLQVLAELTSGYLRIANEALFAGNRPPTAVLYRAMHLLDRALAIQRQHYCHMRLADWQRLLQIFVYAQEQGIADELADAALRRPGDPPTLQGLFYRALVIGLCDPNHHRADRILAWYRWTGARTQSLELTLLPQGAFTLPVDLSGEMAPLAAARRARPGPEIRYLSAEPFLQQIQEDPEAPRDLARALLDLIKGRRTTEQRQNPRQPRNHPFLLRHGLRGIHARLYELVKGAGRRDAADGAHPCRQTDQSKTGSAFLLQGPVVPPLGVGELVLLEAAPQSPGASALGFVGCIRRLVNRDEQRIEIGVEKLAGRVFPVNLSGGGAERLRGDVGAVVHQDLDAGSIVLIAPQALFRAGDTVIAEGATARYNLRMQRLVEGAQRTAHIAVEVIDG